MSVPFAVLGGPPQHTAYKGEDTKLVIGDDNLIREHATMNLGTVHGGGETKVGSNGLQMRFDPNVFDAAESYGTVGLVQNTWRELRPQDA